MEITKEQFSNLRGSRKGNWKAQIVEFLMTNQGSTDIEIYNGTRPDRLDISDFKKMKNVASQLKYLRDEGYMDMLEDSKRFLIAVPKDGDRENFTVVKGQEQRVKTALNIK